MDRAFDGSADSVGQRRKRQVAANDEISEAVEHGYARGFFPLEPSVAVPEPPVVRSFS